MKRRTPPNRPVIRPWAIAIFAVAWLLVGVFGAPTLLAVAQPDANDNDVEAPAADDNDAEAPDANDNDVEAPTPSPSDLLPPVVVPDEEPDVVPDEEPEVVPEVAPPKTPAVCAPPRCRPARVLRCRPRLLARCRARVVTRRRPRLLGRCRARVVRGRPVLRRRVVCAPCPAPGVEPAEQAQADPWQSLFDGETLKNWEPTEFGGQGKVEGRDGMIVMELGHDMTGVTFVGTPPQTNYELRLQAQRLAGHDFFGTTTFPVGEEHCSLVVGGWGGTIVGLSNVDFYDASDNLTTTFHNFQDEMWYDIRIRVSDHKITAWIDDEKVVEHPREGHQFGVRFESEPSRPLGISTWQTSGAVRNIRLRDLTKEEVDADRAEEG